ncbi:hypothetical protein SAMN05445504_3717 [Burkholderia sp. CF099]|nr:hypothetical protein SAMN05445504_3717 [Burkholderia sp. CF099]
MPLGCRFDVWHSATALVSQMHQTVGLQITGYSRQFSARATPPKTRQ